MAAKSSSRGGRPITLVVVHTNEGDNPAFEMTDRRAESLARWMDGQQVSYHKVVDDDSVVNYVPDGVMSWSLRSGNSRSLNVCMIGRAAWSREEWLRHDQMIRMAALIAKNWCEVHGIPKRKLAANQVAADMSGIIGHWDWTMGKRDGSHTDPGAQFPWDVFMRYVLGEVAEPERQIPPAPPIASEEPVAVIEIRPGADGAFRHAVMAEAGSGSQVVAKAWITYGSTWGATKFTITALKADGTVMGPPHVKDVPNNQSGWYELPDGVHMATIEGTASGSVPAAALVTKAK